MCNKSWNRNNISVKGNFVYLKVRESRESGGRWWGGDPCDLGGGWKEKLLMLEKTEQQAIAHTLLLQHPGSCWNTAGRRDGHHEYTAHVFRKGRNTQRMLFPSSGGTQHSTSHSASGESKDKSQKFHISELSRDSGHTWYSDDSNLFMLKQLFFNVLNVAAVDNIHTGFYLGLVPCTHSVGCHRAHPVNTMWNIWVIIDALRGSQVKVDVGTGAACHVDDIRGTQKVRGCLERNYGGRGVTCAQPARPRFIKTHQNPFRSILH